MKQNIIEFAKTLNIEMIGFSKYCDDETLRKKHSQKKQLNYTTPLNFTIDVVNNPKKLLSSINTIITIALPYYKTCEQLENIKKNTVYFSSSSWGRDYHAVLNEKLDKLVEFIKQSNCGFEFEYVKCVDTKAVDDRYFAYKGGIGFFGKNGLIINKKYGSYIFIGSILTNLDIESDNPIINECGLCERCVNNCPTKAIQKNGVDSTKCLSYLTQKKGELTAREIESFSNCIYGCDMCLHSCPFNIKIKKGYHEFKPSGIEFIDINKFGKMSNRQFKEKYGQLSGSWRGKKIVERNIKIYHEKIDNNHSM
ncbi:MAG: tRNA epoxyqueuosine(34) reductase QueG [Bacilli bacterium]